MEIVTSHWKRTLEMQVWSLGTDYSLIRVVAPPKEAGTATLRARDQLWNYLPRVDRTIKIPPSLIMSSWMGSHFTYDDLVKETRLIEDYDVAVGFEGDRAGVAVWEFVLTPKEEAPVVWGRIEEQVRKNDLMPTWIRYYNERGHEVRALTFGDYRIRGGRLVPVTLTMRPTDVADESTVVRYKELAFDTPINPSFFSLQQLRGSGR